MNKIIISGNLCKDIELRYTTNNVAVIQNSIAVRNDFKNKDGGYDCEFINIVAWRNHAEYLTKYANKGTKILVEGKLTNRSYEKDDGTKGYIAEVIVEKVEILNSKKEKTDEEIELPKNIKSNYEENEEISLKDEDLPF